jgi:predicted dehydrogenase
MNDKLGIAILGCGYWGINYVRIFEELPETRVVVVCDTRAERLQEVGRRFPGVALVTNVAEALKLPGVEAAVICTPAATHYQVASQCLAAGKHILVEKPITTETIDAERLTVLAESKKLTLMVGHTFLFNAGVKRVKAYIEQAEVGRIYYLEARRTNLGPIRRDVNAIWDLAPHDISIFNYLLDSTPEWVSAVGTKVLHNCCEDVGFLSLGYPDGIIGHIHVSWANPNKVREVEVIASNKRIVFDDLNTLERVRVFEKGVSASLPEADSYGEYHLQMRDGDIISPRVEVREPLKDQCKHFVECVTQSLRPFTDGWAGLEIVRVLVAADNSLKQNGAPVSVQSIKRPNPTSLNGTLARLEIFNAV